MLAGFSLPLSICDSNSELVISLVKIAFHTNCFFLLILRRFSKYLCQRIFVENFFAWLLLNKNNFCYKAFTRRFSVEIGTAWIVPLFGVFLIRIFPHLDRIRNRKTPNTFHSWHFSRSASPYRKSLGESFDLKILFVLTNNHAKSEL